MNETIDDWRLTDRLHAEQGQGDPFAAAVRATRMAMVITDPRQPDNPIVFANAAFSRLTGYRSDEVIGRNCRFLQGPDTDPATVSAIRTAIGARRDIAVDLLNYRKDGSSFWNGLYISPVTNAAGELQFFFASQLDASDRIEAQLRVKMQSDWLEAEVARRTNDLREALDAKTMLVHEVDHRVKNNLQMVASLVAMQAQNARSPESREALTSMLRKIEALGIVHRRLYQSHDVETFDLADFVRDITSGLLSSFGRDDVCLRLDLDPVDTPAHQASPLALVLNELLTNALKHAFPNGRSGYLTVTMRQAAGTLRIILADDGVGMPSETDGNGGFGRRLIKSVTRQLRGTVVWREADPGTTVEICVPIATPEHPSVAAVVVGVTGHV